MCPVNSPNNPKNNLCQLKFIYFQTQNKTHPSHLLQEENSEQSCTLFQMYFTNPDRFHRHSWLITRSWPNPAWPYSYSLPYPQVLAAILTDIPDHTHRLLQQCWPIPPTQTESLIDPTKFHKHSRPLLHLLIHVIFCSRNFITNLEGSFFQNVFCTVEPLYYCTINLH